jgi:hypothetical protein
VLCIVPAWMFLCLFLCIFSPFFSLWPYYEKLKNIYFSMTLLYKHYKEGAYFITWSLRGVAWWQRAWDVHSRSRVRVRACTSCKSLGQPGFYSLTWTHKVRFPRSGVSLNKKKIFHNMFSTSWQKKIKNDISRSKNDFLEKIIKRKNSTTM